MQSMPDYQSSPITTSQQRLVEVKDHTIIQRNSQQPDETL